MDRLEERQALDRVLDAARRGLSAALVVRGEPGVGKTSLLGYAIDSAAGFQVVRVAGVESELELGFAGLHRLLLSLLSAMEGLPQRQRKALRARAAGVIGGRTAGSPPGQADREGNAGEPDGDHRARLRADRSRAVRRRPIARAAAAQPPARSPFPAPGPGLAGHHPDAAAGR